MSRALGLKAGSIIIDIPEPVSFEARMPLISTEGTLLDSRETHHLFGKDIQASFTNSLRKLRIFSSEPIDGCALARALEE